MASQPATSAVVDSVERVLLRKTEAIKICLAALVAGGHVLIKVATPLLETSIGIFLIGLAVRRHRTDRVTPSSR